MRKKATKLQQMADELFDNGLFKTHATEFYWSFYLSP